VNPTEKTIEGLPVYARIDADRMFTFHMSQSAASTPGVS